MVTTIMFFIALNIVYGMAFSNLRSKSLIGQIATGITTVSTYPVKLFLMATKMKSNGWLIELNFILVAIFLTFLSLKLLQLIKRNKKQHQPT
jgi:large-conductance mechanosensitive channel